MIRRSQYRPAGEHDLERVASRLVEARIVSSADDVAAATAGCPWALHVHDRRPDTTHALLDVWRRGTGMAVVRHLSAHPREQSRFLKYLLGVLKREGFSVALSSLLDEASRKPFRKIGFEERERLIVLKKRGIGFRAVAPACELRPIQVRDIDAIVDIDETCFDELWRFRRGDVEGLLPGATGFVAVQDGLPIGYNMLSIAQETGTVGRLAVRPDHRNRGVGSTLLAAGLNWLADAGGTEVTLCTQHGNLTSRRLYRRFGFEQLPDDVVIMSRTL